MPPYMLLPLQLLLMILQCVQLVISAVLRQKLLMVPLLEDLAVGQHNNVVRVWMVDSRCATISIVPTDRIFSSES